MLNNLRIAMATKNITVVSIASLIDVTEKTARNKINGITEFTIPEALKIKNNIFPEYDLCYLFSQETKPA